MEHDSLLIATVAAGITVAFIFGLIAARLRLAPIVGYVLAGVVVGPFTPGYVADSGLAQQLAGLGVILLMFGVGLRFSLGELAGLRAVVVPAALIQTTVTGSLTAVVGTVWGWGVGGGAVLGLALGVASTVVMLKGLERRDRLDSREGRLAVGWLVVEDLTMVFALVLLPALAPWLKSGGEASAGASSIALTAAIALLKVVLFIALMYFVGRRFVPWLLARVAAFGSRELFTLAVFGTALGVGSIAAEVFGVSFALGAFFAGMLLNESELSHEAAQHSLPMRDAFAVLFFVSVGMLFDPHVLLVQPLLVLATVLIIVLGKSIAAYLIMRAFGHPNSTALTISASLAQIGEFAFIIAGLGVSLKLLSPQGQNLVLAGALISIMLNPLIFRLLDRWQLKQDAGRIAADARAHAAALAEEHENNRIPEALTEHAIVVGYGRVGGVLASLLHARGVPLVVVEDDVDAVARARADGFPTVRGNAASEAVMHETAPERAKLAIFAIPQALEAGESITRLKRLDPTITVLARARNDAEVKHLLAHGADAVVLAERELAHSLAEMAMAIPPYRDRR